MGHDHGTPDPHGIRTTTPSLTTFVLYAERSIRLGVRDRVEGGDVGVRSFVEPNTIVQADVGAGDRVAGRRGDRVTIKELGPGLLPAP